MEVELLAVRMIMILNMNLKKIPLRWSETTTFKLLIERTVILPLNHFKSILFMANHQFCETEFNKKALELFNISEICNDNFNINEKDEKIYLSKKQVISLRSKRIVQVEDNSDPSIAQCGSSDDLISIEYHILFHPSYQVPALFFNAYKGV